METPRLRRWWSLACGLGATETLAMTGRFPVCSRMGGKRSYSHGILEILGEWPKSFVMVDADPAIVDFWRLAFAGRMRDVADVIRSAPLDGEELWRAWSTESVPEDEIERTARWIVLSKGNFSGKPVSYNGTWLGLAGLKVQSQAAVSEGGERDIFSRVGTSAKCQSMFSGLAGYAKLHRAAMDKGFNERVVIAATSDRVNGFRPGIGEAVLMDLESEMPDFQPGDLLSVDPPYKGTTGYGACRLSRERVVEIALAGHEAGCRVFVHEAEPILSGVPWRHVELERRHGAGQRTWSNQQREVLTLSFAPAGRLHHSTKAPRSSFYFAPKASDPRQGALFRVLLDAVDEPIDG